MKIGELIVVVVLAHGFWLHTQIIQQWTGAQHMALSVFLTGLTLFMTFLILKILWHLVLYKEITTLIETDTFMQACMAFLFLDLAIAMLRFTGTVPRHFFIQLVFMVIYLRLKPKIH